MKRKLGAAALDILFSMVVYILFMDKFTGWLLNNESIRNHFLLLQPIYGLCMSLLMQAAAFFVLILYIKLLAEAEPKDYYLKGLPKFRWILIGILSVAVYMAIALLLLPGEWIVQIKEPAVLSVLTAVWESARTHLINARYFLVILTGGMFFGALRRRMTLPAALLAVAGVVAALSFDRIDAITCITYMVFCGIQAAAFSMIAEYTGSVWSAVLFDFSFEILMDEALVNLFHGYHVWIPMDSRVLLIHQANNPNRLLNELIIGTGAYDHARTLPMAIFYLLVIACLYAKIRKREAASTTEQNSAAS